MNNLISIKKLFFLSFCTIIFLFYFSCSSDESNEFIESDPQKSSSKEIAVFSIPNQTKPTEFNYSTKTILITIPAEQDLTSLSPYIITSKMAKIFPASKDLVDFSGGPVNYVVTAHDGTQQTYKVTVVNLPFYSKNILSFKIDGQLMPEDIDNVNNIIKISIPEGYLITKLTPTINLPPNTTVEPPSGTRLDFSRALKYVVTAIDNSKKQYNVLVLKEPSACGLVNDTLTFNNKHYELIKEKRTWEEANTCAKRRGGYLVNINSQEENVAILTKANSQIEIKSDTNNFQTLGIIDPNSAPHIWIGGKKEEEAGLNFRWTEDSDIFWGGGSAKNGKYSNWSETRLACYNQPNNNSGGAGAAMSIADYYVFRLLNPIASLCLLYDSTGKWTDLPLNTPLFYVIEYDQKY